MPTPRDDQIATLKRTIQKLTARVSALEALVARGIITPTPGRLTAQQIRDAHLHSTETPDSRGPR